MLGKSRFARAYSLVLLAVSRYCTMTCSFPVYAAPGPAGRGDAERGAAPWPRVGLRLIPAGPGAAYAVPSCEDDLHPTISEQGRQETGGNYYRTHGLPPDLAEFITGLRHQVNLHSALV